MSAKALGSATRFVVKVGTSAITGPDGRLDWTRVEEFVHEICRLLELGREIVVVTSGAIAAGLGPLGLTRRPTDMPTLQAAAAVGQSHLMNAYASAFEHRGRACGQVLLTRSDVTHRHAYVNALNTFRRLIALGAVPVVNENDTVATDEIRFGENDLLAAMVANLVHAEALVVLSDVDGLHQGGPEGPIVTEVEAITPEVEALVTPGRSGLGSGGMGSKLAAAKMATACGIPTVIARFQPGALEGVLSGAPVGTLFHATSRKMAKRKAWIAFVAVPRGTVVVDDGARSALAIGKRSLLAAGVRDVRGTFAPGDAVDIADERGEPFARGLVSFSSDELQRIAGLGSAQAAEILGTSDAREVVHRDELVLL